MPTPTPVTMPTPMTMDDILMKGVDDWFAANKVTFPINRKIIKTGVLNYTRSIVETQNMHLPKKSQMRPPDRLANIQIAEIIKRVETVTCISCNRKGAATALDLLGVYQYNGPNQGVYDTSDIVLDRIIMEYNYATSTSDIKGIKEILLRILPRTTRLLNPHLIALNNCIFDYKSKTLLPFDPQYVFLSKSRVNLNLNAQNITIHNPDDNTDWDVESWMKELHNDPDVVYLYWQLLGAIIRPLNNWNKCAFLFSKSGNSGKGTLCELMRNLCGNGSWASISLYDLCHEFRLEEVLNASAIIVDKNDVGVLVDKGAAFKAIVTRDAIQINPKHRRPITFQPLCFMVQCVNDLPRIKDKSGSLARRQLIVPFDKCFTGQERKYIKDDYLSRPKILEYVVKKVLVDMPDYYEFSEPDACKEILKEYQEFNDPIKAFLNDVLPKFQWDFVPNKCLYELYKNWSKENNPSGKTSSKNTFYADVEEAVKGNQEWYYPVGKGGKKKEMRVGHRMSVPEPLINAYCLTTDWDKLRADTRYKTQGIVRRNPRIANQFKGADVGEVVEVD